MIHLAPGDPVHLLAGQSGDEQYFQFIRAKYGLDQPLASQLWTYLSNVLGADLGYSLNYQQAVTDVVFSRVPATLLLMTTALALSSALGVLSGVEAARRRDSFPDRAINAFAVLCYSVPSFSIAQTLMIIFSLHLGLFPAQGMTSAIQETIGPERWLDIFSHLLLPAMSLALVQFAVIARLTRTEVLNALGEDFITTARAKGLTETRVIYGHALRNALLPIVTVIGNDFGMMLSGAVLVETVFAWPGLGRLMIDSIAMRDYPVLMGLFLIVSLGVVVANLITDIIYSLLDPRISYR